MPIDLGGNWPTAKEWDEYWKREVENLEYNCKDKILDKIDRWEYKRIALFGFAPMPLLVKLGTMLNNKHEVVVYQKQRSGGWKWLQEKIHTDYIINRPEDPRLKPVLVLSLSFPIAERIKKHNPNASIWEMTIDTPNPEFLKSKQQLYDLAAKLSCFWMTLLRLPTINPWIFTFLCQLLVLLSLVESGCRKQIVH